MTQAFKGIQILDFTQVFAGPFAGHAIGTARRRGDQNRAAGYWGSDQGFDECGQ